MKFHQSLFVAAITMLPTTASAWEFGRKVRGPDYLDPYLYFFGFLTAVSFIAVALTKPASVPFNQMYRAKDLPILCKTYHRMFSLVALPFLAILLTGPGILIYERDFKAKPTEEVAALPPTTLTGIVATSLAAQTPEPEPTLPEPRSAPIAAEDTAAPVRTGASGAKFISARRFDEQD